MENNYMTQATISRAVFNRKNWSCIEQNGMIGIQMGKSVYHWFTRSAGGNLYFVHSYSQNTGKIKRGYRHQLKVHISIFKAAK
jgi:hypothetical protein